MPLARMLAMTDTEYLNLAEAALLRIEQAADRINDETDADIDAARNGGVITLAFAGGSQIVINLQRPLHEIWLAARAGGFHYRHQGTDWRCTKKGTELFADLSQYASEQAGMALAF